HGYPNGCPIVVGGLDVAMDGLAGASYRIEQRIGPAEAEAVFARSDGRIVMRSWMAATENLLVTEIACEGSAQQPVHISPFVGAAGGEAVQSDAAIPAVWFKREAPSQDIRRAQAAVATRVFGATATLDGQGALCFTLKPGERARLVSCILSDLDAADCAAAVTGRVAALRSEDLDALNAAHRQWWRDFWGKSFVEIPDKVIERQWYAAQYVMASCSRAGKYAPGLYGNWITTDTPGWAGDYHLNYNYQAPWWGVFSSNHVELAEPYDQPLLDYMPRARENARTRLNCRGVLYEVGVGPKGLRTAEGQFWGQKSNAAYAAVNMVMRFYHTYDLTYARDKAYPFLREVGDFWEDYLKFEDGRYVIYNDAIHEDSEDCKDMNPILSLGLVPMVFRTLIDMSTELGADAERREKWQHIVAHMSEFPIQERGGMTVFRYTEKGRDWCDSNTLGLQHIWPAGAIGLGSDPRLLEIGRNTVTALNRWEDNNGFPTFYTAAARVGYDPKTILDNLRIQCERHTFPNLYMFYGGGGIESCGGTPSAVNEMLLQSHEGILRLFPVWPRELPARFGCLRAVGAFLVSSALENGQVQYLQIESERGRGYVVQNPWPGRSVTARKQDGSEVPMRLDGDCVTFATEAGGVYRVEPVK
ncbi:MAG: alpha-L-fucosidase 2, partial [Candidatus Hydrogenedentes bacterium]|nr:alpha-L-fucosidase 2 [Candidatus Hydrogenedentota bacterium]